MSRKQLLEDDASQYDSINQRLRRLEQGIPEDPHYVGAAGEPTFQNSWVNFDAAAPPSGRSAYFYRHNGRVWLGGVVKSGASGTVAFTLPVGYRYATAGNYDFVVPASATNTYGQVSITQAGGIMLLSGTGVVTNYCFLEGVSFRHA